MKDILAESLAVFDQRPLKEDTGDVPVYLNVTEFVKSADGQPMPHKAADMAQRFLSSAINENLKSFRESVRKSMAKYKKQIESNGLALK